MNNLILKGKVETLKMQVTRQTRGRLANLYRRQTWDCVQRSPYENIYYCCTQRTGSQYFRNLLKDPTVYKYTGLLIRPYIQFGMRSAIFHGALPKRTICTHLYIDYPTYLSIPKPKSYKTFFLLRDPRDVLVSMYFAARYSHTLVTVIPKLRVELERLNLIDGFKYLIDQFEELGVFYAQKSWIDPSVDTTRVKIFRYEDFARDNLSFVKNIFDYLNIEIPEEEFNALYKRHNFKKITRGRTQGEENKKSHYRKGISGDWKNYFDDSITAHFKQVTGDLLEKLGYPEE